MAYFGPPVGFSSWSGGCAWSGCQVQAQAPAPQYYPAPAQFYPPQPPSPQYIKSSFEMHPIFWVFLCFIALKLCYSDFYWIVQCLPNPSQPAAAQKPDQKQQKEGGEKKDDNKKNDNQKGGGEGKKGGKEQKEKDEKAKKEKAKADKAKEEKAKEEEAKEEKAKEEKAKEEKAKEEKAKEEKAKEEKAKEEKAKEEKATEDKLKEGKANPIVLRPSCKYFAGQRVWVTENSVRWWGILVLDRGGGNWYGHKVVYGGKRHGRPALQTVPFFAAESGLQPRSENFGSEKEPQYVNKTIICGCP